MNRKNRRERGFSLIELLIVVAIILIIVGIAVPSYLAAKRSSNAGAAASSVDGFMKAAQTYQNEWNTVPLAGLNMGGSEQPPGTPATCAAGGELTTLDSTALGAGTMVRSGYTYSYVAKGTAAGLGGCPGATSFEITALPQTVGVTGNVAYCADVTGHFYQTGAGVTSTGISCATDGYTLSVGQ